jgi:phasin family protein
MSAKSKATDKTPDVTEPAVQAVQAGQEVTEKTVEKVEKAAERVTTVARRSGEAAAAALKQATVATNEAVQKGKARVSENVEKAVKTAEEFVSFGQGNLEAVIKSGQILATGLQDIGKQVAAQAQARFDEGVATFRALSSVKSVKEAVELQATYARSTVEKAMADTGKLTDASFKLAEQALAPITARVTLAVEKFGKAV